MPAICIQFSVQVAKYYKIYVLLQVRYVIKLLTAAKFTKMKFYTHIVCVLQLTLFFIPFAQKL